MNLKSLALLALLALGGKLAWDRYQTRLGGPAEIKDPIYAELKVAMTLQNRTIEQVMLVKMADMAECSRESGNVEAILGKEFANQPGQSMKVLAADCSRELTPRQMSLFDNKPSSVTYLSLARGARQEREARVIVWGLSVEESNLFCDALAKSQASTRKGAATCVRALES